VDIPDTSKLDIYPVILCGGAGSRLWPMSRPEKPKQFHNLVNDRSLLVNTIARMPTGDTDAAKFHSPVILGNKSLEKEFRAEMNAGDFAPATVILEPVIRDTAPAIAAVTAWLNALDSTAIALVVPSDARIDDHAAFHESVIAAAQMAATDQRIMTLGIRPTRPDTQYGYIERGGPLHAGHTVTRFHEKPDLDAAQRYLDSGKFVWNAGMFLYRVCDMAATFARLQPDIWAQAGAAVENARHDGVFVRLEPNAFAACERLSMDYAIMENADRIGVVEADFDWDDLGSWAQLYARAPKREDGNAVFGNGFAVEATGNYIRARDAVVAVAGIDDLTVVAEDGKVLVVPTAKSHLVKSVTSVFKGLQETRPGLSEGDHSVIRNWLFNTCLPFWHDHGLDRENGGVHEALGFDGAPDFSRARRLRVAARQIYSFSRAHLMGWNGDGPAAVTHCFDFLTGVGWHDEGGWIHLTDGTGAVIDDTRDLYDQCFCILGFAWMIRAGISAEAARHQADRTLAFMDDQMGDMIHGGYVESKPQKDGTPRRANPHMHFLEAMLAMYEATGESDYLDRAERIIDLFDQVYFDAGTGTLTEFFAADWRALPGGAGLSRVEPGHHYEWTWLLLKFLDHRPYDGLEPKVRSLFASARAFGHHAQSGAVADTLEPDGSDMSVTARCWPQTEALKAAIAFEKRGASSPADLKRDMLRLLFERYLVGPVAGGWYDSIDETGRICARDMPSSTLYHVVCALAEYLESGA